MGSFLGSFLTEAKKASKKGHFWAKNGPFLTPKMTPIFRPWPKNDPVSALAETAKQGPINFWGHFWAKNGKLPPLVQKRQKHEQKMTIFGVIFTLRLCASLGFCHFWGYFLGSFLPTCLSSAVFRHFTPKKGVKCRKNSTTEAGGKLPPPTLHTFVCSVEKQHYWGRWKSTCLSSAVFSTPPLAELA